MTKYINELVLILGWGRETWEGIDQPILQAAEIDVLNDDLCRQVMIDMHASIPFNAKYLTCAGDPPLWDKDSCQNDSGGKY